MAQTIIASAIVITASLYIGYTFFKAVLPGRKKKGCACCGCGDKAKDPSSQVISINR
jgi:hypothetical protein